MSRLGSSPAGRRVAVAKPKNDIYVALLAITLGALILACVFLALEMNKYEWKITPNASIDRQPTAALASIPESSRHAPRDEATSRWA